MKLVNKRIIVKLLSSEVPYFSIDELEEMIEIPPLEINFSYAFPVFKLAKHEKKDAKFIAKDLMKKIVLPDYLETIEASGTYLNFRVKSCIVLGNVFELQEDYGKIQEVSDQKKTKPLRIVVEYPSPNTNKPLHLGHIRNMLIGSTLSSLFQYKGHYVFQVNLNNDRGIHICKSMLAYKKWGNNGDPIKKSDHYVGDFYVKYNQEEERDKNLLQEANKLLKLWEQKDPETRKLWKKMTRWALDGFRETYRKFNISFDKEYFESNLYKEGKDIILKNVEKGILNKTEEGAVIAHLKEKYKLSDKILLRSNGTSIYITQDIFLAYLKKKDFNYDRSIYIVGNEQNLYFKQLFAVLDLIGFKEDKYHLSYGMISLPEGRMKSREGSIVDADDIIAKMQNLAYQEVNKRYPELSEKEKTRRAKIIGNAALRFFILKFNPKSDFVFNPKESIAFEGETGSYVQYTYTRIESIITKSKETIGLNVNFELLIHDKEIKIINQLNIFPEIVDLAVGTYGIHLIPQYLLTLCQLFNSFYSTCPVISDNKELERARLLLIRCVQIVIKIGLKILGIETLDNM